MALMRIAGVSLTVPDLDEAARFYGEAFGFVAEGVACPCPPAYAATLGLPDARIRRVILRLGAQRLELLAFDPPGRPYPDDSTASDLWFQHCAIVVSDMAVAHAHLARFLTKPITQGGPQRLPANTGGVTAWKFRDPFGHPFELLQFPQGVGHPDWHRPDPLLFQGIDHTAIAVGDCVASIAFYERRFGFTVTSRSHNRGPEQSRLDGFGGADVEVVALSPASEPPHLELLAYRAGERRPRPAGWTSAEMAVGRTMIAALPGPGQPVDASSRLETDPDGHAIVVSGLRV